VAKGGGGQVSRRSTGESMGVHTSATCQLHNMRIPEYILGTESKVFYLTLLSKVGAFSWHRSPEGALDLHQKMKHVSPQTQ